MILKLFNWLKSLFLQGLFTVLPIATTIFIIHFVYTLISRWIAPVKCWVPGCLKTIPGIELGLVTLFILLVGALLKFFILGPVIKNVENLINKIPLIRIIYSSSKILVDFFNVPHPETAHNQQVILIPFPRTNCYSIAFLLGSAQGSFQHLFEEKSPSSAKNNRYVRVFMPNSPNPTSGYFFILPEDEVIMTDMSFEDAIKTIVSCGIFIPPKMQKQIVEPSSPASSFFSSQP